MLQQQTEISAHREFLHNAFDMTDDILLDRLFKRFDTDNDGYVNREEWILGLSIFLKGSDTERVQVPSFPLQGDHFARRLN